MPDRMRSPFGTILREERLAQGVSQAQLARRIAERFDSDPTVAELGVVSDRAIANIEAAKSNPEDFVRPRAETVRVLMLGLGIDPTTERGQAMLRAATATQRREKKPIVAKKNRYQTPFVYSGREVQWAALKDAWKIALTGEPQIRLIEGTAGMGKTRLVEEFCRRIIEDPHDIVLARGECSSGTANVEPYLPWRRAISSTLRTGSSRTAHTSRDGFIAASLLGSVGKLGGVLIDLEDLEAWLTVRAPDRIADLKRIRETWSPTNTMGRFDEFVSIISMITSDRPTMVVLEDLHWADESSCSLLLHLQRQMRLHTEMPLMVIGTYRSSDLVRQENRHPLLQVINEMQRQVDSLVISLEPTVANESSRSFIAKLVREFKLNDQDHDALVETLYQRTNGHPLFTTELIQRLVDTTALHQDDDGTWALDRDKVETQLPGRMKAIIDERIQRLPDDARTIVEAASVQGSPFTVDIIPAVTGLSEAQVDLVVDRELVEKHRIFQLSGDANDVTFAFDHDVIAETVYETLSPHRRRSLHRRTAEALIDEHRMNPLVGAPNVAHHFEQANMPAEAAEHALVASFAALSKLDHDLTLVWVDRSERLAKAANDDVLLWQARIRRAHVLRSMGAIDEALSIGLETINEAARLSADTLEAEAHEVVALVYWDKGRLEDATEFWHHSSEIYERLGRRDRVSANYSMLSHIACRIGRLDGAIRHAKAAWAAAPDPSRDGLGAEALLAEGNALFELGRYEDAIDVYERSLATYTFTGEMRGIMLCRMNIAHCYVQMGQIECALPKFEKLRADLTKHQTPRLIAYAWFYEGKAHEANQDYARAKLYFERAYSTRRETGLDAMGGDDLAGVLRAAVALGEDVETHLNALQAWWRAYDPGSLEDPLLAILSLVSAYEYLGNERQMKLTLNEGAKMFIDRADQIQNPAIRDTYLQQHRSGNALLARAQEAGLVER